jgi:hypothetical protein
MITYRKTKQGKWVVFGPLVDVVAGTNVTVAKRDGSTKVEFVERVGRPFRTADGEMVYGYIAKGNGRRRGGSGRCKECGGSIKDAPHHRAMEGFCGSCAFDEFDC